MLLLAVFAMGWVGQDFAAQVQDIPTLENQVSEEGKTMFLPNFDSPPADRPGPHDRIAEDQIHVYRQRIVIDLQDAEWASFTDTNSMDPVIDAGSNALEIVPGSHEDIHVGDIVSYESQYASGTIIHRVVETGEDQDGWYCRMKGDNLDKIDPGKVRFEQIRRVVVGIIY
jgi:hypothetical protein